MSSQHANVPNVPNVPHYFVPAPSGWPVYAGASLLVIMIGAASWVNEVAAGPFLVAAGLLALLVILYKWFGDAIGESESGLGLGTAQSATDGVFHQGHGCRNGLLQRQGS